MILSQRYDKFTMKINTCKIVISLRDTVYYKSNIKIGFTLFYVLFDYNYELKKIFIW